MNRELKIDFMDSEGRKLFSIPDGGLLRMIYGNGEDYFAICRYLDEAYVKIDRIDYPILEFVRKMEQNGISYIPA